MSRADGSSCRPGLRRRWPRALLGARARSRPGLGNSGPGIRAGTAGCGGADPVALAQDLGQFDGVGRSALAQVVRHDPKGDTAVVGDRDVAPDASDHIPHFLWKKRLLDRGTSATLLIGILGLIVLRKQIELGLRPFVKYERRTKTAKERFLTSDDDSDTVIVTLQNAGMGPAIIKGVEYYAQIAKHAALEKYKRNALLRDLTALGLVDGRDFLLIGFSAGTALTKESTTFLGEFPTGFQETVDRLELVFEFAGLYGNTFSKRIICLPKETQQNTTKPSPTGSADSPALP